MLHYFIVSTMFVLSGYEVGLTKISHGVQLTFRYAINSSQGCYCGYLLLITLCLQIASILSQRITILWQKLHHYKKPQNFRLIADETRLLSIWAWKLLWTAIENGWQRENYSMMFYECVLPSSFYFFFNKNRVASASLL